MKRILKPVNLLWLIILIVALVAIKILPWDEIFTTLRSLTLIEGLVILAINALILLLFSARWWFILSAYNYPLPYLKLSAYRIAGFALSYFTPGTQFGGEPLQAFLVQSRHQVPGSLSAAAVALDKSIELMANFSFLIIGILLTISFRVLPGIAKPSLLWGLGLILLFPIAYWIALRSGKHPLNKLLEYIPAHVWSRPFLAKLPSFISDIERQFVHIIQSKPWLILWMLLISALVWFLMVIEYGLMAHFLGAPLSGLQALAGFTATRISFLTPLPGGAGVLEAGQAFTMQAFGYSAAVGISLSLLMRARDLLVGLFGLWVSGAIGSKVFTTKVIAQPDLQAETSLLPAVDPNFAYVPIPDSSWEIKNHTTLEEK